MRLPALKSKQDVEKLVAATGFLPFFRNELPGFSVEELTPPDYWFVDGVEGPWEWKEQITGQGKIAYGKLFRKRAGYVSLDWYPDLCNFRRDGYDFEGFFENGLAPYKSREIVETLEKNGPMLSKALKETLGYVRGGKKGFDTAVMLLQMQTFVAIDDFVYQRDRFGRPYGWGVARYCTAEQRFSEALVNAAACAPAESLRRITDQLMKLVPGVSRREMEAWIR